MFFQASNSRFLWAGTKIVRASRSTRSYATIPRNPQESWTTSQIQAGLHANNRLQLWTVIAHEGNCQGSRNHLQSTRLCQHKSIVTILFRLLQETTKSKPHNPSSYRIQIRLICPLYKAYSQKLQYSYYPVFLLRS